MTVNKDVDLNEGNAGGNHDASTAASFQKRTVAKYVFLPGIIPEIKNLLRGGFGYLAFLIALVYQGVRILPANHPFTRPENINKFGIHQVISVAANNVKFNRKNLDQVVVFFAILSGLVILTLQFFGFILMIFTGTAFAQDAGAGGFTSLFATANPDTDIAFYMIREVFGLPDLFGTLDGGRSSLHIALQTMFQFYNLAILAVAILVFLYYVIVVIAETAQSGTPFGQRFSHIYAPIRLVIAIGLLVPLSYGFNGAQYVTFFAAKLGSGFATTGWTQFNASLDGSNPLGADNATLIAETKRPDVDGLVEFMSLAVTCREAHALVGGRGSNITAIVNVDRPLTGTSDPLAGYMFMPLSNNTLETIADAGWSEPIEIIFGKPDPNDSTEIPEAVNYIPSCGKVIVPVNTPLRDSGDNFYAGLLQESYYLQILALWESDKLAEMGRDFALKHKSYGEYSSDFCSYSGCAPPSSIKESLISQTRINFDTAILEYYEAARAETDTAIQQEIIDRGWGGAGIWYNRIAQINGAYVTAVRDIPDPKKLPTVMHAVQEERRPNDTTLEGCRIFERNTSDTSPVDLGSSVNNYYADTLDAAYQYWACDKPKESGNFILSAISFIFGLDGLLTIRDRVETGEVDSEGEPIYTEIHPLAKLSTLGKGLIESAIMSLGLSIGSSFLGGLLPGGFGSAFQAFTGMFTSIATIGLSLGFITYYILPFLPFIYFFFAVGNWVKSIFEAMVGAPLWALAHLRIDGDGLPGKMAMNGYLLILEIFLRPILTIFGLLGGMAVFTTLAAVTNDIFDVVVRVGVGINLEDDPGTFISMHLIDVFFFTIVYAVILYMMAVSSFKMINLVPNNILRWLGNSVDAFSDNAPDPTQGLTQYAAIGGAKFGGDIAGGIASGAGGLGSAVQAPFRIASGGNA